MSKPEKRKIPRIVTFDVMRGFFLIAILVNHIYFFPNYLDWLGMRGALLVTTAEGFFLLSGVVLGVVRGAKLVDAPFRDVATIVLKRALQLYITYVIMVIAFTLIAWNFYMDNPGLKWGVMTDQSLLRLVWETMTSQYTYGWADYLRYYAFYIAVSPIALWLLRKGKWYLVLAASFVVWLLAPDFSTMEWHDIELLQPIPWQIIFFSGLVIGFHWPAISDWCTKRRKVLTRFVAIPLVTIATLTFAWNIFSVFAVEFIANAWTQALHDSAYSLRMDEFDKEQMPLIRFALFMLWFWAWFLVIEWLQKPVVKYTGWLLIPFGTNSLYVYTLHAVIVFFIHLYFSSTTPILNFIITAGSIALIYLAIRKQFLMKVIPR